MSLLCGYPDCLIARHPRRPHVDPKIKKIKNEERLNERDVDRCHNLTKCRRRTSSSGVWAACARIDLAYRLDALQPIELTHAQRHRGSLPHDRLPARC